MIYKVLSNLNHNGTQYAPGALFDGLEGDFASLVQDKILEPVDGAASLAQAKEILAENDAEKVVAPSAPETTKPQDTWGPQPDKEIVPPAEEVKAPETAPGEVVAPTTEESAPVAPTAPVEAQATAGEAVAGAGVDTSGANL